MRDTLFPPDQRVFDYRNEKIEGDKASVEVKNNFGSWDMILLVREEGLWKIDKKATSDQMIQQVETSTDDFEEEQEKKRKEIEDSMNNSDSPNPDASLSVSPENPANPTESPSPTDSASPSTEPTSSPMK
jgi:hypothetical protein